MKKRIDESEILNELREGSAHFRQAPKPDSRPTSTIAPKVTRPRIKARKGSSSNVRQTSRKESREPAVLYPTRNEVQEFSFRLRDELKVKVQAEVPHHWQKELEELARTLDVKKLELYRFIIGEFLGKVKRKRPV